MEGYRDIYDPRFVADLFDRCAPRYRRWSAVASFGMLWLWRRICARRLAAMMRISQIKGAAPPPLPMTYDLMSGTGEVWPHLWRAVPKAQIVALDSAGAMLDAARVPRSHAHRVTCRTEDAVTCPLPEAEADLVISAFGLKTLSPEGQVALARQIARVLRPGGAFALIEASDPKGWALRPLYLAYLGRVLPLIERSALRGAQDFAMIGAYVRGFGDVTHFTEALRAEGLFAAQRSHVFGCATSVAGFKPVAPLPQSP